MKLTIKTLQQSTFTVETEPDKTVKDLKDQIEKEQGKNYPCGAQKLIYSGKILADESKLSEYNIDEKKFIVLMITRPPPAPKPAPTSEKAASSSAVKSEAADTKAKTDDKSSTKSTTSSSTVSATSANPTTATTRSSARLSSSTNNPPAAAAAAVTTPTTATTTAPPQARNDEASILSAMSEPQLATRLAMLMSQPQFRQIQDHIQQSPHLLSQTIESLAASDPEMYSFISDNPDVFVNALNHPPMAYRSQGGAREQQQGGGGGGAGRPSEQGRQGAGMEQLINVSEHDKEAIERLKELGFSEYLAVQAYMACDKDEQLAANLLFQMDQ